jgi:antitoxin MazE
VPPTGTNRANLGRDRDHADTAASATHTEAMSADPTRNVVTTAILRLAERGRDVPTKIQRWGNSQGIRVPKSVLADAGLEVGDVVDVRAVHDTLVVTRARSRRGRASLEDLVAALPEARQHGEPDWGRPEGDEV